MFLDPAFAPLRPGRWPIAFFHDLRHFHELHRSSKNLKNRPSCPVPSPNTLIVAASISQNISFLKMSSASQIGIPDRTH